MPTYRLAIPFVILLGLGFYLTWEVDTQWSLLIISSVVILVAGFLLAPQINWWWWQRFPPDLGEEAQRFLQKSPVYKALPAQDKREFRRRLFLFGQGQNFMPQGMEKVPDDVQLILSVAAIRLTWKQENFLFPRFENIVVYPHVFPSPQYPDNFHASEVYEPDGVLLFCQDHIIRGFLQPNEYLNLAWYEYAKVFALTYPQYDLGDWEQVSWENIEAICGFSHEALLRWVGLPTLDKWALGIACYFLYPDQFERELPVMYKKLQLVFA